MKTTFKILIAAMALSLSSCEKFLDRPELTSENDETAWTSEDKLRLYANKYFTSFFVGYGSGYSTGGAPLVGYTNHDDYVTQGQQGNFTRAVPNSSIWSYSLVRSLNIMIERIESEMSTVLSATAKNHWLGVARFYRGFEYSELALSFGDVPYYDREIKNTELDLLYKPRDPRNTVMDAVYEDWKFAMENVRVTDGDQSLNRYVVAGFISRLALYEATWQKYYYKNNEQAKKFFELAIEAAQYVMNRNYYTVKTDYRSLFSSRKLQGNTDVVLYRNYDAAAGVTHAIASYGNLQESTLNGPTADLLKAYLLNDGNVWQSGSTAVKSFDIDNMIKTRDPRFEATFYGKPNLLNKGSFYYVNKFLPRDIEAYLEKRVTDANAVAPGDFANFTGDKNETDAPVLRYSEVLLNFIEAKAELATIGGAAVTQADIDKTINVIRKRPTAPEALAKGVAATLAPMSLIALPNDPNRDPEVSDLIWEIRRERRMEFAFETSRQTDLKRWSKLEYMDNNLNKDLLAGGWVNFAAQLPSELKAANVGILSVEDVNGNVVVYNGSNNAAMVGFFKNQNNKPRLPFLNQPNVNPYLTPVGITQMDSYVAEGYVLKQTEGWPQN